MRMTWPNSWECDLIVASAPQICRAVLYIWCELVQFQKQKRKRQVRWRSEIAVQERAKEDAAASWDGFHSLISRNKLHICLRSGLRETDHEMRFYWAFRNPAFKGAKEVGLGRRRSWAVLEVQQ